MYHEIHGRRDAAARRGDNPTVLAINNLNEPILATPAIADRAIFLRSDAHLWCFAEKK